MTPTDSTMAGKTCLITGATAGIGEVAARELARRGATVVLVGRSATKSRALVEQIQTQTGNPAVEGLLADLSSLAEVRRLAQQVQERHARLHVLINNAGALFLKRQESVDGFELTFALNHLAYFLLTSLLLDTLRASAPARIINVSSRAHRRAVLDFSDLQHRQSYGGLQVYSESKLENLLFTYELARRLEGTGVTVNALHPGVVATRFGTNNGRLSRWLRPVADLFCISAEAGARTIVYLATAPEVEGVTGKYFIDEKAVPSSPASYDRDAAARLWQLSEELTKLAPGPG
jgi:NAD(P)-dependent dehydrogenase (short-subunit alcohol dehydrogenase family)